VIAEEGKTRTKFDVKLVAIKNVVLVICFVVGNNTVRVFLTDWKSTVVTVVSVVADGVVGLVTVLLVDCNLGNVLVSAVEGAAEDKVVLIILFVVVVSM
jgi:hypothetical protein